MVKRDTQLDESHNDTDMVRGRHAVSARLPGGLGDPDGIRVAGRRPTISAAGLSDTAAGLLLSSTTAGLPRSRATSGLSWSRIRRTNHGTPAAAGGSGSTAAPRACDGMDAGLLELGRPLGVDAGPLRGPSLPSCRLGRWPLAPAWSDLGLGPGALATLGSARGMVAAA